MRDMDRSWFTMPRKQIQVLSKVLSMHVAATCRAYQYEPVLRVQAGSVRLRRRQDSERALSRKRAWRREKAGRGATTRARGAQLSASRLHRHSGVTGRHGLSRAVTRPPVTCSTGLRVMSSSLVHCTFTACLCRLHSLPQPATACSWASNPPLQKEKTGPSGPACPSPCPLPNPPQPLAMCAYSRLYPWSPTGGARQGTAGAKLRDLHVHRLRNLHAQGLSPRQAALARSSCDPSCPCPPPPPPAPAPRLPVSPRLPPTLAPRLCGARRIRRQDERIDAVLGRRGG